MINKNLNTTENILTNNTASKLSNIVDITKNIVSDDIFFDSLKGYLEQNKNYFRDVLAEGFESFIEARRNGLNDIFIKLPTGTGKTSLFCHLIKAVAKPTIVLVPRIPLIKHTYENLVGGKNKLGVGFKDNEVNTIYSGNKGSSVEQLENIIEKNNFEFKGVLVITYASLNEIRKKDYALFEFLVDSVGFIISDEAHRGLGKKTLETKDYLTSDLETIDKEDLDSIEKVENEIQGKLDGKIHLSLTATPQTIFKNVGDYSKNIFSKTLEDVEKMGHVIIPKQVSVGNAKLYLENYNGTLKQSDLEGPLDKYTLEDGSYVYEMIAKKYLEEKESNNGYLPGIGFCNTVKQADFILEYLIKVGIRAIKVTSDIDSSSSIENYSPEDAEKLISQDKADIVITVMKLREGWDMPLLRASLNFTPTGSPVKSLQGTGRITRTVEEFLRNYYINQTNGKYIDKTNENTIIIEPNTWEVIGTYKDEKIRTKKDEIIEHDIYLGEDSDIKKTIISGSYLDMYKLGEISYDKLMELGIEISETVLLKEEALDYFKTFKDTEEDSYNYWFNLEKNNIGKINIKGYRINKVATLILGENRDNSINSIHNYQVLINTIFGKKTTYGIEKEKELTKEEIITYFRTFKKTEEESYEYWANLGIGNARKINIKGHQIDSIRSFLYGKKGGIIIDRIKIYKEFINEIFGKELTQGIEIKRELTKEEIITYFKTFKDTEKESYNYWFNLGKNSIKDLKIGGYGIIAIKGFTKYNIKHVSNPSGFKKFINILFGKEENKGIEINEKRDISNSEITTYFKTFKDTEKESYNYWFNISSTKISEIQFGGHKLKSIGTIIGWDWQNNKVKVIRFKQFINNLFGKKENEGIEVNKKQEITNEEIITYFKTFKNTEKESYNYWFNISSKKIPEIQFGGHGINSITRNTIWDNDKKCNSNKLYCFKIFINFIFGKKEGENINKKDVKEKISKDDVFSFFKQFKESEEKSYEYWTSLFSPEIEKIKFKGHSIASLSNISGFDKKDKGVNFTAGFKLLLDYMFGGEKMKSHRLKKFTIDLKNEGIYDMETLLDYGTDNFRIKFGIKPLTFFLGRVIKNCNVSSLKELGNILGYKEKTRQDYINELLVNLKKDGVYDMETLISFGTDKFNKKYGFSKINKVVGKTVGFVDTKILKKIGKLLGFKEKTISEIKNIFLIELKKGGIKTYEDYLDMGVVKFKKKYGIITVNKILGGYIESKDFLSKDFEEFGKTIGLKSEADEVNKKLIFDFKNKLEKVGIIDNYTLVEYSAKQFGKDFGTTEVSEILGRHIRPIKIEILIELGDKLGFVSINDGLSKRVRDDGITNMEQFLDYGATNFKNKYKTKMLGLILEKKLLTLSVSDFKKLGLKIGFKEKTTEEFRLEFKEELNELGIIDMNTLFNFGVDKFKLKFGLKQISSVIGKKIGNTLSAKDMILVGKLVGFKEEELNSIILNVTFTKDIEDKIRNNAKIKLLKEFESQGIFNINELLKIKPSDFYESYGVKKVSDILNMNIKRITNKVLIDLGKKIWG